MDISSKSKKETKDIKGKKTKKNHLGKKRKVPI